jgi:hypothetical protein
MLIVQQIEIIWTKESRGGKQAVLRNSIPKVHNLPEKVDSYKEEGLFEHRISYYEFENFKVNEQSVFTPGILDKYIRESLIIELIDNRIKILFNYDQKYCGAPYRYTNPEGNFKNSFILNKHQIGRVEYNGRFSDDEWWYKKQIFNICLTDKVNKQLFINSDPDFKINYLEDLW